MQFRVPHAVLSAELSDEGGVPVVQLHGLTSSRARDREIDLDLGRGLSGTRLLRYDARGHGRSTGRAIAGDYEWPVLAEDLLALLEEVFPGEAVHAVGPSMGAATALHAAVAEPARFRGLTLMIPPTAWETRPAQGEAYRAAATLVEGHGVGALVAAARLTAPPPAVGGTPVRAPEVEEALLPSVLRGAAASDLPARERIAALEMPVSILAWVQDPGHPLATAEALEQLIPAARLRIAESPAQVQEWPEVLREDVARG